jgi:hypothetical protein
MSKSYGSLLVQFEKKTDLQNKYHEPEEDEKVTSISYRPLRKTPWDSGVVMKLTATRGKNEEIRYSFNPKIHRATNPYLTCCLPEVKVKSEYLDKIQICWTHNVGHNIISSASLISSDEDYIQTITSRTLDAEVRSSSWFLEGKSKEFYDQLIGNVPFLVNWSTYLPRYSLTLPQPWFYGKCDTSSLLLLSSSENSLIHNYDFCLSLSKLIRMREFDKKTSTWKNISFSEKYLENFSEKNQKIEDPEFFAECVLMTKPEREFLSEENREYHIEDYVIIKQTNPIPLGKSDVIDLKVQENALSLMILAENCESSEQNYSSNYTTDSNDVYSGWNPISQIKLVYGSTEVFNFESNHFSGAQMWYFSKNQIGESGYNLYSFQHRHPKSKHGVNLHDLSASLNIILQDSNPFASENQVKSLFQTYVLVKIVKTCILGRDGKFSVVK